ncbi:glycosyltransferase [Leucobacter albus]|uniref:Glycosyltransferase n=1 Tax=Leucobacter albus TaxID=272210 RepID=A0ABW3TQG6_9MICO
MLSTPRVSVIIPVYNAMPYLTGAIESVLAQDLTELELIAVNDGSTDGSAAELDRLAAADERITVIHQPNSGWPGLPRNRGIDRARGEFLFFMDADDTMAPNALSAMTNMALSAADEGPAEVVIPRFEGTGGRGVQSLFARHPHGPITVSRAMETLSPQKLFHRAFVERHRLRFPEAKVRLEDGIFVTQAYVRANRILFCGREPLYFIALRSDGQNISSRAIDAENYVASCRQISRILIDGTADPETANRLVLELFQRKGLRFYSPTRWHKMSRERRATWVALHREFLRDVLPAHRTPALAHPTDQRKLELIRAGRVARLNALIAAEGDFAHVATATSATHSPERAIELRVAVTPAPAASAFARRTPAAAQLSAARRLDGVLTRVQHRRYARGIGARARAVITWPAPQLWLVLNGRRKNRTRLVRARLVGYDAASGAYEYVATLSPQLLAGFRRDRVDLRTVAGSANGFGPRALSGAAVRLLAGADLGTALDDGALPGGPASQLYATNRGNASIRPRPTGEVGGAANSAAGGVGGAGSSAAGAAGAGATGTDGTAGTAPRQGTDTRPLNVV